MFLNFFVTLKAFNASIPNSFSFTEAAFEDILLDDITSIMKNEMNPHAYDDLPLDLTVPKKCSNAFDDQFNQIMDMDGDY